MLYKHLLFSLLFVGGCLKRAELYGNDLKGVNHWMCLLHRCSFFLCVLFLSGKREMRCCLMTQVALSLLSRLFIIK